MRRSSSTTSRWGASSGSAAKVSIVISCPNGLIRWSSGATAPRTVGGVDQVQHFVALIGVEHADEKASHRIAVDGAEARERAADPRRLQGGKPQRQGLTLQGREQQPLAAVGGTLLLFHI